MALVSFAEVDLTASPAPAIRSIAPTTNNFDHRLTAATVTLVVPTMNEAGNIGPVLRRVPAIVDEIIVVDGGSTDDTVAEARAARPDVLILGQDGRGKGDAVRVGMRAATSDIVVMIDADGSMSPEEIPLFVTALLEGADLAKGSRYMRPGGSTDFTFIRDMGNRVLREAVNRTFDVDQTELCYGYMAWWRHHNHIVEPTSDGFELETSIVLQALKSGLNFAEVPSFETERVEGVSKLVPSLDGVRVFRTILGHRLLHYSGQSVRDKLQRLCTLPSLTALRKPVVGGQSFLGHDLRPIAVATVDRRALPSRLTFGECPDGRLYQLAKILVRDGETPMQWVTVELEQGAIDQDDLRRAIRSRTHEAVLPSIRPVTSVKPHEVTLVVSTRELSPELHECLARLVPFGSKILVVGSGNVFDADGEQFRHEFEATGLVEFVHEPDMRLTVARNRGLALATTQFVGFLNDDIIVEPWWFEAILAGFATDPELVLTAGFAPPRRLDSPEQLMFEAMFGWSELPGLERVRVSARTSVSPLFPFEVGKFASGAHLMADRIRLLELGGFDEDLGPGTRPGGGDDIDIFLRVLKAGLAIGFEPSAIGWHDDDYAPETFLKKTYLYGTGLTAALVKHAVDRRWLSSTLRAIPKGIVPLVAMPKSGTGQRQGSRSVGPRVALANRLGRVAGPFLYAAERRTSRRG